MGDPHLHRFLATAIKWAKEAIQKFWLLYHALGWRVPLLLLILYSAGHAAGGRGAGNRDLLCGFSSMLALDMSVLAPTLLCLVLA